MQIGLGSRVAAVTTNFNQGALQLTGRVTDLAIQGNGFFVVERGGQQLLTRDGAFNWDSAGQLVTAGGARVLGWTADPTTGSINSSTPPKFISVPTSVLPPAADRQRGHRRQHLRRHRRRRLRGTRRARRTTASARRST